MTRSREQGVFTYIAGTLGIPYGSDPLTPANDQSMLRIKMLSSLDHTPFNPKASKGILHFIVEYDRLSSLFGRVHGRSHEPDEIRLEVDRYVIYPSKSKRKKENEQDDDTKKKHRERTKHEEHRKKKSREITLRPNARTKIVLLKKHRHYAPLIRYLELPVGSYKRIKVYFKKHGTIRFGDDVYQVRMKEKDLSYKTDFKVEEGKITTLHAVPKSERHAHKHEHKNSEGRHARGSREIHEKEKSRKRNQHKHRFKLEFKLHDNGYTVSERIRKIYLTIKSISAVNVSGQKFVLSNKPTTFELLELLSGAVALVGHNSVPPGEYRSFELVLDGKASMVIGTDNILVPVEHEGHKILEFEGPFTLRGGRITEIILGFDPDSSVFVLPRRGHVMDPEITVESVLSLTSEQEGRLVEALGARSNLVACEAEMVFQASVARLEYRSLQNKYGRYMIYSDMDLKIEDPLRASPEQAAIFPFSSIGGTYSGVRLDVAGMPKFENTDRFLLFLKKYGDKWGVVRGDWGKIAL